MWWERGYGHARSLWLLGLALLCPAPVLFARRKRKNELERDDRQRKRGCVLSLLRGRAGGRCVTWLAVFGPVGWAGLGMFGQAGRR
ncbi:hypothetical protein BDY21DRAFT_348198 [Lineolata rhizophorae]|uniref:Uncharacterized protein n=1 Tax=Lineolata rhizophorae TaxID=578093 RepID=A0A6A6NXE5_9PEZI|nr:hypothetical protein BDY21DRAFT_348198 [Lineolata rhizophorae]